MAWPGSRTAAMSGALLVAVLALSSGIATYAAAMLSVQVAQFLLLLVVVPALLVLGAPLELWRLVRASDGDVAQGGDPPSSRPLPRLLTDPLVGMLLVAGLVFAVYRTELLGRALGDAGLSMLVCTAALAVGCLLVWPALSSDPRVRVRGAADRVAPLLAASVSLLLLAVELHSDDQLLARRWFVGLGWSWVDPTADQRVAALFATSGAVLLLALALAARRPGPLLLPYPEAAPDPSRPVGHRTASPS